MADVRELLRNELASRRSAAPTAGKKRKHGLDLEPRRKKTKPYTEDETPAGSVAVVDESSTTSNVIEPPSLAHEPELDGTPSMEPDQEMHTEERSTIPTTKQDVDEDEWAAFEREVAQPSRQQPATTAPHSVLNNNAIISAAPVSAAELESRDRQDREAAAKSQEATLLGDREDATRFLEEEFDEMEELDQRVKRLKEMRDEIRRKREEDKQILGDTKVKSPNNGASTDGEVEAGDDEDDDDDDDGEGWDGWGFR
ncbi:uncharacterized protein GIQ15_01929 [Arthroderma uncinatum]|uniref:uncharacterized protein n=1 Tax=Arthroderma uncinatum TaxID=74035 RepID=UPI00144ADF8F|nr:uncharacterized protein GIQ15_01929 [Arthroderma uncinatum]KAF3492412.1 hypothetical protein GIQ15_01929 [Arthroderma uncinatum]